MRFNQGDLVKVSKIDSTKRTLYVPELDDYVGKVGTIITYDITDRSYRIKFSFDEYYWFHEDWLELANNQPNQTNDNSNNNLNNNLNNLILLL